MNDININKILDKNEKLILSLLIFLFLILEFSDIRLPGLFTDEAFHACGTLQLIKNSEQFLHSVKIFNLNFPLMLVEYAAAAESYILLPFLLLFGVNVIALRLASVVMVSLGLIFLYYFIKKFFDKKAALLSIILLVINPVFLLETKLGLNSGAMLHFATMGTLLCFFKWYESQRILYFILGIFLLGLGLSMRAWFAWFVGGLLFLAIIYGRQIGRKICRRAWVYFSLGLIAFMLGSLLLVYYNLTSNFSTLSFIGEHFNPTRNDINNFNYIGNFIQRIKVFTYSISGSWSFQELGSWFNRTWPNPYPFNKIPINYMLPWVFYLSFIWLAISVFFKKPYFVKKRLIFFCILIMAILLLSPFTLSSLGGPHLFILYPFVMITIAATSVDLMRRNKVAYFFVAFLVLIIISINIGIIVAWQRYFILTGGTGSNSDAIYDLVSWVEKRKPAQLFICDWGFYHNVIFLSQGKTIPLELYSFAKDNFPFGTAEEDRHFAENCRIFFQDKNREYAYIFHSPEFTNVERYSKFSEIAQEMGKTLVKEKTFYQRDGRPVYVAYSVR